MVNVVNLLPFITDEEVIYLQGLLKDMDETKAQQFAKMYDVRRRNPTMILICTLPGFFCFAGIQRFVLDEIGMGLLYFFTFGFLYIGTIVDLVNYKQLTMRYNTKVANRIMKMI